MLTDVNRSNGMLNSWEEEGEFFEVVRDTGNRPIAVKARRGKWGTQTAEFLYSNEGIFQGLSGNLQASMLPTLIAEAQGVVTAQTDPTGVVGKLLAAGVSISPVVVIGQQHVAVSKTDSDVNEATLYSLTIPALMLGPNDALRINTLWTIPNSATQKKLRVKVGGQELLNSWLTTVVSFERPVLMRNRNSRASQIAFNAGQATGYGTNTGTNQVTNIDFGQEQTLIVTAEWGTAGAGSNSITLESVLVELIRAA